MKQTYFLTAWYWRITRKTWWLVCILMTVGETAAVLLTAASPAACGLFYDNLFLASFAWLVFAAGYLAAMGVSLRPTLVAQGKSKASYTLATLPHGGWSACFAQMLCTALSLMTLIVWQLMLMVLLYLPATAINRAMTAQVVPQYAFPAADFQLAFVRNVIVRALIPTTWGSALGVFLLIAAPSILLCGALFQRGVARVIASAMGAVGAVCCLFILARNMRADELLFGMYWQALWHNETAILIVLLILSFSWTARNIKRAQWL